MAKQHCNTGSLTKRFILMLVVLSLFMLSACSYINSAPSIAQTPSPAVISDEEQPDVSYEEIQEPTSGPLNPPVVTQAPEASAMSEEVQAPTPASTPKPSKKPVSKTPPKASVTPEPSGEAALQPTIKPKPTIVPSKAVLKTPSKEGLTDMEALADEILKQIITKGMSEAEKVKTVHDYIIVNTVYYENEQLKPEDFPEDVFTTKGVLLKGEAVCQGYAETFQLFMNRLGIDSKFVVGKDRINQVGHAWNMVSLGGNWYHVDATWDDPVPDQKGKVEYKYFLITDEMLSLDHSWNKNNYPVCNSTEYLYYIYEEYMINSIELYEQKFVALYKQGERTITILYPEEGMPELSFFFDYDFLHTSDENGTKHMGYKHYPIRRLGEYTVYTVIVD